MGGPMVLADGDGTMSINGRACAPRIGTLSVEQHDLVYYYTIFPTMFISPHPDYVMVHRLYPQAPGQTRVICEWLFEPEAVAQPDFSPRARS